MEEEVISKIISKLNILAYTQYPPTQDYIDKMAEEIYYICKCAHVCEKCMGNE